jgi:type VI secretion system protein ImpC
MSNRAELEVVLGAKPTGRRRRHGDPFRLIVCTDLGTQVPDAVESLKTQRLTVDNFDDVLAKARPTITVAGDDDHTATALEITSLEALHPDHLVAVLPRLRALLQLRERLAQSSTEQAALSELARLTGRSSSVAAAPTLASEASAPDEEDDPQLFERLLGKTTAPGSRTTATEHTERSLAQAQQKVRRLIDDAFAENEQTKPASGLALHAQQQATELLGDSLRALINAPRFRGVERAWRSLHWLVSRLEDDQAEVHVLNLPKDAASLHLTEYAQRLDESPLHNLLCEQEDAWDMIVADWSFDLHVEDLTLLATIGALAMRAGAPCIAHGSLGLVGCGSDAAVDSPWEWSLPQDDLGLLWAELRRHPAARWVGLAAPRFLLRHPYGPKADPIESFRFEELPSRPARERFVWGNPAFACALIAARAHEAGGARWPLPEAAAVEDLPAPLFDDGSGEAVQPPVEFLLSERAHAAAMHGGLMVAAGGRNVDYVSFSGLFPIAAS